MAFPDYSKISLNRPITSYAKMQKLIGNLIRNCGFQLKSKRIHDVRYLNIGCGRNPRENFINLDYLWHPEVDVCWDISTGLPFPISSMQGIFSEHCLEHFSLMDATRILMECKRILKPGGIIRIVVPDAEKYLKTYCRQTDGDPTARFPYQEQEHFHGMCSPILNVNRVFYQDRDSLSGHRFMYDFHVLGELLRHCGFTSVSRRRTGEGTDPVLLIDAPTRAAESLYVEARAE
jgi:predicted SAM-dependent methyltransferase